MASRQRSLLGGGVDNVARGVVTMSPNLDMDEIGLPIESAYEVYKPAIIRKLVQGGVPLMRAQEMFEAKDRRAKQALLQASKERPVILDRSPVLHRYGMMAYWPKLIRGHAIQVNQYTMSGLGMDLDGDCANFQLPISSEAVEDAKRLMLPSQNLLNITDRRANYTPEEDYVQGLFAASRQYKKTGKQKVFATINDLKQAYARGEVSLSDAVELLRR
jgi:DNA-directed RNA polymerase subunit beta'